MRLSQFRCLFVEGDARFPVLLPERGQLPGKVSSFLIFLQPLADTLVVEP